MERNHLLAAAPDGCNGRATLGHAQEQQHWGKRAWPVTRLFLLVCKSPASAQLFVIIIFTVSIILFASRIVSQLFYSPAEPFWQGCAIILFCLNGYLLRTTKRDTLYFQCFLKIKLCILTCCISVTSGPMQTWPLKLIFKRPECLATQVDQT